MKHHTFRALLYKDIRDVVAELTQVRHGVCR